MSRDLPKFGRDLSGGCERPLRVACVFWVLQGRTLADSASCHLAGSFFFEFFL